LEIQAYKILLSSLKLFLNNRCSSSKSLEDILLLNNEKVSSFFNPLYSTFILLSFFLFISGNKEAFNEFKAFTKVYSGCFPDTLISLLESLTDYYTNLEMLIPDASNKLVNFVNDYIPTMMNEVLEISLGIIYHSSALVKASSLRFLNEIFTTKIYGNMIKPTDSFLGRYCYFVLLSLKNDSVDVTSAAANSLPHILSYSNPKKNSFQRY